MFKPVIYSSGCVISFYVLFTFSDASVKSMWTFLSTMPLHGIYGPVHLVAERCYSFTSSLRPDHERGKRWRSIANSKGFKRDEGIGKLAISIEDLKTFCFY